MPAPESRAAGIAAEMDALCAPSRIVELRPKATNRYAATVAKPRDMLSDANPSARDSRELIRSVIERIVLNPGKRRGRYEVEIHGQSAVMLGADQSKQAGTKSTLTVVAGARNHRELTLKVAV